MLARTALHGGRTLALRKGVSRPERDASLSGSHDRVNNKSVKHIAASVRERLYQLAQKRGEDFQLILTRYGLERLLYRLDQSPYRDRFVLKGGMLFSLWGGEMYRATRDVDFLGFGDSSTREMEKVFQDLCAVSVEDDGLVFNPETVGFKKARVEEYPQ